jgi:hypothetical protein
MKWLYDCDGDMMMAYARKIGRCSILHVELWALAKIKNHGHQNVIVESDALTTVNMIQSGESISNDEDHYLILRA